MKIQSENPLLDLLKSKPQEKLFQIGDFLRIYFKGQFIHLNVPNSSLFLVFFTSNGDLNSFEMTSPNRNLKISHNMVNSHKNHFLNKLTVCKRKKDVRVINHHTTINMKKKKCSHTIVCCSYFDFTYCIMF